MLTYKTKNLNPKFNLLAIAMSSSHLGRRQNYLGLQNP